MKKDLINQVKRDVQPSLRGVQFKLCPVCRSKKLVKFDMDFFCMDCDWNSILIDVYSGNFERRIAIVNRNRHRSLAAASAGGVVYLRDLPVGMRSATVSEEHSVNRTASGLVPDGSVRNAVQTDVNEEGEACA